MDSSVVVIFCFKQKTAYERRISDWSSDVCSSDLAGHSGATFAESGLARRLRFPAHDKSRRDHRRGGCRFMAPAEPRTVADRIPAPRRPCRWQSAVQRSEEHTSELQSLMRISYAVFCLKKKNNKNNNTCTKSKSENKTGNAVSSSKTT